MKCHLFLFFWQWAYPKYSRKENESKSFFAERMNREEFLENKMD